MVVLSLRQYGFLFSLAFHCFVATISLNYMQIVTEQCEQQQTTNKQKDKHNYTGIHCFFFYSKPLFQLSFGFAFLCCQ